MLGGAGPTAQRVQGEVGIAQLGVIDLGRLDDEPIQPRVQVGDALPEAGGALERQQIHGEPPAVTGLAEHTPGGDRHVVEVDLTELVHSVHRP